MPRPRPVRRRRPVVLLAIGAGFLLVMVAGALAIFRYLPALDEARALRTDLETMVTRVEGTGLGIDRPTMDALHADLASARGRLRDLQDLLAGDPLIRLARAFPPTAANTRGADDVVGGAGDLLDAGGQALTIGDRFVGIR